MRLPSIVRNNTRDKPESAHQAESRETTKAVMIVMKLCVKSVLTLLTLVSLLSSLYSVSSLLPKSEFLIMPNMLLQLRVALRLSAPFGMLCSVLVMLFFSNPPSPCLSLCGCTQRLDREKKSLINNR